MYFSTYLSILYYMNSMIINITVPIELLNVETYSIDMLL